MTGLREPSAVERVLAVADQPRLAAFRRVFTQIGERVRTFATLAERERAAA